MAQPAMCDGSAIPVEKSPSIHVIPVLARVTFIALVAYTGVSMAIYEALDLKVHAQIGPISIYLFDILLLAAVTLLFWEFVARGAQSMPDSNRTAVFLAMTYCAYQLAVVLPVAVVFHDLAPVAVFRELEVRLGIMLIPFMYLVVLRYVTARHVILLIDVMAVTLALWAVYKYATIGPEYEGGTRLREVGGWAVFAYAFLILTSLFLLRPSIGTYVSALLGAVGIALSNHRSGYLALIVVGVPLFVHFRRASTRTFLVVMVAMTCGVFVLAAAPTVRQNVAYSLRTMLNPAADQNARDRVDRSRLGWDYFVAHPLGDHAWNQRFYLIDVPDPFEPHNFVIQILDEQGIVGFTLFMAVIVAVGRVAWRNRSRERIDAVMLAAFAFYLVFCLLNTNIINQWNVLLLAAPAGLILKRNAEILAERDAHDEPAAPAGDRDAGALVA